MINENSNESEILDHTGYLLNKTLRIIISEIEESSLEKEYYSFRKYFHFQPDKGLLVDIERMCKKNTDQKHHVFENLIYKYGFNLKTEDQSQPSFPRAKIELKNVPLIKNLKGELNIKEGLTLSKINYLCIVDEEFKASSFIKENQNLLIIFYLYDNLKPCLDFKIIEIKLINLLENLSVIDLAQIQADWEYIVNKIRGGEAHLLSEGQTSYLSITNDSKNRVRQPNSQVKAKTKSFYLKRSYVNSFLTELIKNHDSILSKNINSNNHSGKVQTIESFFESEFLSFIGKNEDEIAELLNLDFKKPKSKSHRRMLVNRILGVTGNKIKELTQSNTILKVIKLEKSGKLSQSLPFPVFKYNEIVKEKWESSKLFRQLTENRFVFVVFKDQGQLKSPVLIKFVFWHFPMKDIEEAKNVWNRTVLQINSKQAHDLPKMSQSYALHVRPHALNKNDTLPTPYGEKVVKKCFWLNAKFIEPFVQ